MSSQPGGNAGFAFALLLALCAAGCTREDPEALLERAYALGQDYAWQEARPLVVEYLHARPDSPAGHYLLGRCYLHRATPALRIALGEFDTAAAALERNGGAHHLDDGMTTEQFRAALHKETARVHLRWCHEAMEHGLPEAGIRVRLEAALERVRRGRALDPEDAGLAEMEETLTGLLRGRGAGQGRGRTA